MLRDHQFFVGGGHPDGYDAVGSGICGPPAAFDYSFSMTPSRARFLQSAARTRGEFSPMPAVNTNAANGSSRLQKKERSGLQSGAMN
jgi:hypothetical protein